MGLLNFTVEGEDKVLHGMTAILDKMKDLTPFWKEVWAPKYFALVQDLFNTSGTPRGAGGRFSGQPWAKLSPKYRVWKAANYGQLPTLVRTGAMRESVRWMGDGLGAGGVFQAGPTFVIAGTSIPYAAYHNTGTSKMPKRQFLPPPDPAVFGPLLAKWLLKTQGT